MTYFCNICKKNSKNAEFYSYNRTICKQCSRIKIRDKLRKIRSTPEGRQHLLDLYNKWYRKNGRKRTKKDNQIVMEWVKKNKEKHHAELQVQIAVRKGELLKPENCTLCGKQTRIVGHHTDYSKIYAVMWVCDMCHKRIHLGKIQNFESVDKILT